MAFDRKVNRRKYYLANKEKAIEKAKRYYKENKEFLNKKHKERYDVIKLVVPFRAKMLFDGVRKRARNKGWDFNLDVEWIEKRLDAGVCELSGVEFCLKTFGRRSRNMYAPSIDRKNPAKGYTKRNSHIVLSGVNFSKSVLTMGEYKKFLSKVFPNLMRRLNCEGFI